MSDYRSCTARLIIHCVYCFRCIAKSSPSISSRFFVVFTSRSLETIEVDVTKSIEKLNEIVLDNTNWEETTKLRLKNGKSTVKTIGQKYENILKQTASIMEKTSGTNELLANKNVNSRKEITDVLKLASAQLDVAEKSGKAAEKLLKQAKAQGDKESAKYLKFVPAPAPVTASITTDSSAK
jgi:hypothetical protein